MALRFLILSFILLSSQAYAGNEVANHGHRAGSDYHKHLPENSLSVLEASLRGINDEDPLQIDEEFLYLEFDIRETYDNELVVFHDKTLIRMLPYEGENTKVYDELINSLELKERLKEEKIKPKDLRIKDLTAEEIRRFTLIKSDAGHVPSLLEFLSAAENMNLIKPVLVEIKDIRTQGAREKLFEILEEFKRLYTDKTRFVIEKKYDLPHLKLAVVTAPWRWSKVFGNKKERRNWCKRFKEIGLGGIYMIFWHRDMC
jgi:glycerophosphoryl diester phosphodiesterase